MSYSTWDERKCALGNAQLPFVEVSSSAGLVTDHFKDKSSVLLGRGDSSILLPCRRIMNGVQFDRLALLHTYSLRCSAKDLLPTNTWRSDQNTEANGTSVFQSGVRPFCFRH